MHLVIVEDEPLVQQRLRRLSKKILGEKLLKISVFDELNEAEAYLDEHCVDLLLLDLNLQGRDGFSLLKSQVAASYHTIIVSAYADKAIDAFEYGVLDFVAKPFTEQRLSAAFQRVLESQLRSDYGCRFLSVKIAQRVEMVPVSEVSFVRAEGHYSELNLPGGDSQDDWKTLLHNKSIDKISDVLPENFSRVHRSYLVNMNKVKQLSIAPGGRYTLELVSGHSIPVGRTRYKEIMEKIV
jgi:DNA-binding LytR/AlgR family response regulator